MDRTTELWSLLERYERESRVAAVGASVPGGRDGEELKREIGSLTDDLAELRSDLGSLRGEVAALRDEVLVVLRGMLKAQEEGRRAEARREEELVRLIREQIGQSVRPLAGIEQLHQEILSGLNLTRNKMVELTEEVFELRDSVGSPLSDELLEKIGRSTDLAGGPQACRVPARQADGTSFAPPAVPPTIELPVRRPAPEGDELADSSDDDADAAIGELLRRKAVDEAFRADIDGKGYAVEDRADDTGASVDESLEALRGMWSAGGASGAEVAPQTPPDGGKKRKRKKQ